MDYVVCMILERYPKKNRGKLDPSCFYRVLNSDIRGFSGFEAEIVENPKTDKWP